MNTKKMPEIDPFKKSNHNNFNEFPRSNNPNNLCLRYRDYSDSRDSDLSFRADDEVRVRQQVIVILFKHAMQYIIKTKLHKQIMA